MVKKVVYNYPERTIIQPARAETFWETSDGQRFTEEKKANEWQKYVDRRELLRETVYKTEVSYGESDMYIVRTIKELRALADDVGAKQDQVAKAFPLFSPQWVVIYRGGDYGTTEIYPATAEIEEITSLYKTVTQEL